MKKIPSICVIILLFVCVFQFSACVAPEDKLIGTWEYRISSGNQIYASITYTFSKSSDEYFATIKMGDSSGVTTFESTYEIKENIIVFTLENGNTISETYSLNGNELTIDGKKYIKK